MKRTGYTTDLPVPVAILLDPAFGPTIATSVSTRTSLAAGSTSVTTGGSTSSVISASSATTTCRERSQTKRER